METNTTKNTTCNVYIPNWNNPPAAQGWECPRCGRINAPWMSQCTCSRGSYTISTTSCNDANKEILSYYKFRDGQATTTTSCNSGQKCNK